MKRTTFVSSLVAIGIAAIGLQPASAQSFWDIQKRMLGFQGGQAGDYMQISNNMRVGINNAQNSINNKVSSGQMNGYTASMLQNQLRNIDAMTQQMGADRVYSTSEVQQLLSNLQQVNSQIEASNSFAVNPYLGGGGFGYPVFNDYNSVYNYQQQLFNQINAARVSDAQRRAWLNDYRGFSPHINRREVRGNYRDNQYVKQMIKLQERIREQQRIADRDRHDRRGRWN